MALEDFDEAIPGQEPEETEPETEEGSVTGAEAQDEDLFGFDQVGHDQESEASEPEPVLATPAPAAPAPAAPAPAAPAPVAPAPVAPVEAAATATATATANQDIDLDEDLFDFSTIFAGGDVASPNEPAVEDSTPAPATAGVPDSEPVGDRGGGSGGDRGSGATRGATAEPTLLDEGLTPAAAPARAAATLDDPGEPLLDFGDEDLLLQPIEDAPARRERDRVVIVLAIAFLVVNTALILLAWQANNSFHDTLRGVTTSIADGLSRATAPPAEAAPRVEYVPVRTSGREPERPDLRSSELDPVPVQQITNARALMSRGQYIDARQTLYHLLANRDMVALSDSLVAETEFLIAETYELQGSALAEEAR